MSLGTTKVYENSPAVTLALPLKIIFFNSLKAVTSLGLLLPRVFTLICLSNMVGYMVPLKLVILLPAKSLTSPLMVTFCSAFKVSVVMEIGCLSILVVTTLYLGYAKVIAGSPNKSYFRVLSLGEAFFDIITASPSVGIRL